jgi:hypothetical protein
MGMPVLLSVRMLLLPLPLLLLMLLLVFLLSLFCKVGSSALSAELVVFTVTLSLSC